MWFNPPRKEVTPNMQNFNYELLDFVLDVNVAVLAGLLLVILLRSQG